MQINYTTYDVTYNSFLTAQTSLVIDLCSDSCIWCCIAIQFYYFELLYHIVQLCDGRKYLTQSIWWGVNVILYTLKINIFPNIGGENIALNLLNSSIFPLPYNCTIWYVLFLFCLVILICSIIYLLSTVCIFYIIVYINLCSWVCVFVPLRSMFIGLAFCATHVSDRNQDFSASMINFVLKYYLQKRYYGILNP